MSRHLNILTKEQNSTIWQNIRKNLITATDVSSILGCNPFKSDRELLIEKCYTKADGEFTKNNLYNSDAVNWGHKFEPIAKNLYEKTNNCKVCTSGLIGHNKIDWLAATPDGFVMNENRTYDDDEIKDNRNIKKLVELKCPFNRDVYEDIPIYYWMQTQIQMEVCDVDSCDLFVCKFLDIDEKNYETEQFMTKGKEEGFYWKLHNHKVFHIKRDKRWFSKNVSKFQKFYNDMMYFRDNIDELIGVKKRRRSRSPSPPNKKQKVSPIIHPEAENAETRKNVNFSNFIAPSSLRNYFLNEPLLDYLKLYGFKRSIIGDPKSSELGFIEHITKSGIEFEKETINNLMKIVKNNKMKCVEIADKNYAFSLEKYEQTIAHMKKGVDVIFQGVLIDYDNKIRGIPDILIRSDKINTIFDDDIYPAELEYVKNILNKKKYHYVPVEIKYATLILNSNGSHLRNDINFMYYKAQVYLYGSMLSNIQGVEMNYGCIIGRKYKYTCKKEDFYIDEPLEKMALIDFGDTKLKNKVQDAINWVVDLRNNGSTWKFFDEKYYNHYLNKSNKLGINNNIDYDKLANDLKDIKLELFPNMNNTHDAPYHNFKKTLAKNIGEITNIWYLSLADRENLFNKGIYSYYDVNIGVNKLNVKPDTQKYKILDGILNVNKLNFEDKYLYKKEDLVNLKKNILKENFNFFVDFETCENNIFLIGMCYYNPIENVTKFRKYLVDVIDDENIKNIIRLWIDDMYAITRYFDHKKFNIYHWGHAERTWYKNACNKYFNEPKYFDLNFVDMCDTIRKNPVFVKGCVNFGLKNYANSLYNNRLINTKWEDNNIDGLGAMIMALNADKIAKEKGIKLDMIPIMNEICIYNEVDCKVLYDIYKFVEKI